MASAYASERRYAAAQQPGAFDAPGAATRVGDVVSTDRPRRFVSLIVPVFAFVVGLAVGATVAVFVVRGFAG